MTKTAPTPEQYTAYQQCFDYFNDNLFGGKLPPVFLNFSRSGKRTRGFFRTESWAKSEDDALRHHEITLCPRHLNRPKEEILSTLVNEMVHLWQHEYGKPSRTGYHNAEWAQKMEQVGLMPSTTGQKGGAKTGQRVTHYIMEGGLFDRIVKDAGDELDIPVLSFWEQTVSKKNTRTKYECPHCHSKVYGKKNLAIKCSDCIEDFEIVEE